MFKKIFLFLAAGMFIFGMSKISLAMMCGSNSKHSEHMQVAQASGSEYSHEEMSKSQSSPEEAAVDVGNKICPVFDEKIDEKMKSTYEYQGKIYNFCCAMCIDEFKKDPEKYIKKVEEELQAESGEGTEKEMEMMGESNMPQGMHGSHR